MVLKSPNFEPKQDTDLYRRLMPSAEKLCSKFHSSGAYAAFPAGGGGGGLHFKLERTLGYQSLKYDI